jgi:hypothetical protein
VRVGVLVRVGVAVRVGVLVRVAVAVLVGVAVGGSGVDVGDGVGVAAGVERDARTSWITVETLGAVVPNASSYCRYRAGLPTGPLPPVIADHGDHVLPSSDVRACTARVVPAGDRPTA